jgi:Arc/MetJ-type ribon-helix-helix transcriptional regulator
MNIILRPDIQRRIDEKVRSGEFESPDAVVEQALTFFLAYEEEEMDDAEFLDTKAAIDEARAQAERGEGTSLDDFDQRMRAKYGIQR